VIISRYKNTQTDVVKPTKRRTAPRIHPPWRNRRAGETERVVYQEADGALVEVGARVVGARVAGRELGLEDEAAELPEVDVRVRVQPLRARVALVHRRPPPPPAPDLVPHPLALGSDARPLVGRVPRLNLSRHRNHPLPRGGEERREEERRGRTRRSEPVEDFYPPAEREHDTGEVSRRFLSAGNEPGRDEMEREKGCFSSTARRPLCSCRRRCLCQKQTAPHAYARGQKQILPRAPRAATATDYYARSVVFYSTNLCVSLSHCLLSPASCLAVCTPARWGRSGVSHWDRVGGVGLGLQAIGWTRSPECGAGGLLVLVVA
jgi:hypothetical protein